MNYSISSNKRSRAVALRNQFSPFGNKLIESGYVTPEQMQQALLECHSSGQLLTDVLSSITGTSLPPELVRQYKKTRLFELKIVYGLECIDLDIDIIDSNEMAQLVQDLISIDICRRYKLFPLKSSSGDHKSVVVAMTNPDNLEAQDDLNRVLRPREINLQRVVITRDDYEKLLERYFQAESFLKEANEQILKDQELAKLADLSDVYLNLESSLSDEYQEQDVDNDLAAEEAADAPIINLVNKILAKALQEQASDIHFEPQEDYVRVRLRKDGVLNQSVDPLPKKIAQSVVARFKIMADLDIAERRIPQDGKIRRIFQGRKIDFRISTLPSRYGEKVVLRILDNYATQLGLNKLITDQKILEDVRSISSRPFGLILVTGPTGSGKSTTLYSMLSERNDQSVNICTVEDPIEYSLPGITQVQVIREKGIDFASVLRSFLRQDPDIILVGETRDRETAKTALEAALTGHLVLTTLHTNDAAGAIARLEEMGLETFLISGSLLGILAQRLVRKVCLDCRIPYNPNKEELARYGFSFASEEADIFFYKANSLTGEKLLNAKAQATLCPSCSGSGYKGRIGVYEVMLMTETIERLINQQASTDKIKEAAVEEGMVTLLSYSLNLVKQGYTTLEEVERVIFTDAALESELKARRKNSLICQNCQGDLSPEWLDCPYCLSTRLTDHFNSETIKN
jgi:type IV pilus assembly protein PilB